MRYNLRSLFYGTLYVALICFGMQQFNAIDDMWKQQLDVGCTKPPDYHLFWWMFVGCVVATPILFGMPLTFICGALLVVFLGIHQH